MRPHLVLVVLWTRGERDEDEPAVLGGMLGTIRRTAAERSAAGPVGP